MTTIIEMPIWLVLVWPALWAALALLDGWRAKKWKEFAEQMGFPVSLTQVMREKDLPIAHPVPRAPERLVPDGKYGKQHCYAEGWNDCIDAMLDEKEE